MIKNIVLKFKNLDNSILKIMINGFKFSFIVTIISTFILITYKLYMIPILYTCGTILFKTSLMFFVDFGIMAFSFDKIKKQMI